MSASTRAMQEDDFANPAMLWLEKGESLWSQPAGSSRRSCSDCHGEPARMRGVAARYPAFDDASRRVLDLGARVEACRVRHQQAPAFGAESESLLGLTMLLGHQSRGMQVSPPADPRLDAARARGRALYETRIGQLNLSCAQCHDARDGERLGAAPVPQAHPTAYPIYRLEWQTVGSLQRRLRNCMIGVRARPHDYGSQPMIELEAYLMERARGMAIETPGVRP